MSQPVVNNVTLKDLEERMNKVEERQTILADMNEIRNLKWTYFYLADNAIRGQDEKVWDELLDNYFTKDAKAEWTGLGGHKGIDALKKFFKGFNDTANFSIHQGHNPIIKVGPGDMAYGQFYLHVSLTMKAENQPVWIGGIYHDWFQKVDGKWFFKEIKGHFYYWTPYEQGWVKKPYLF